MYAAALESPGAAHFSIGPCAEPLHRNAQEQDLVRRVKAGDEPAFRELVELYQSKILGVIHGIVRNPLDVEEIAQDVFAKVYFAIQRFDGRSSLFTWIYRIAVNQARNRHRFWRRRHRADQVSLDEHVALHGDFL